MSATLEGLEPYAWFVQAESGNTIYWTDKPRLASMAEDIAKTYGRPLTVLYRSEHVEAALAAKDAELEAAHEEIRLSRESEGRVFADLLATREKRDRLLEFRAATLDAMERIGGVPLTDRWSEADAQCAALECKDGAT